MGARRYGISLRMFTRLDTKREISYLQAAMYYDRIYENGVNNLGQITHMTTPEGSL